MSNTPLHNAKLALCRRGERAAGILRRRFSFRLIQQGMQRSGCAPRVLTNRNLSCALAPPRLAERVALHLRRAALAPR